LEELEKMYSNATTEDEKSGIMKKMDELHAAELESIKQREIAKANIIQKYAEENAKYVEEKEFELSQTTKKEKDKQIAIIERNYAKRIELEQKALDGMKKLQQEGDKTISDIIEN